MGSITTTAVAAAATTTTEGCESGPHVLDQGEEPAPGRVRAAAGDVAVGDVYAGKGGEAHGCGIDEGAGVVDEIRARHGRAEDNGCLARQGPRSDGTC